MLNGNVGVYCMRVSGFLLVGDLKPDLDETNPAYQGPYRY